MDLVDRRLVAILVADVVGYSALMEQNEADTLSRLFALRAQLVEPAIGTHGGTVVKTTGDGVLARFQSAVKAVEAATSIQRGLADWPDIGEPLQLRIGVHVGDVVVRDGDIYGDGVNLAARLEQAAAPGSVLVSFAVYDQITGDLKKEFTDAGTLDLKNISRPVQGWQWGGSAGRLSVGTPKPSSKPSLAVLPFENLSRDPEQDYLAVGMVEDLNALLSRFHWFKIIARASIATVSDGVVDPQEIGESLGVEYLLQGSLRRAGDRLRVSARLVDTSTQTHIWADRFDAVMHDIFDVQDQIVESIVRAVIPQFVSWFQPGRAIDERPMLSSWEVAMRGWNAAWDRDATGETLVRARSFFEKALEIDSSSALAQCGIAFTYCNPYYQTGISRDPALAIEAARTAVEIDRRNAFAWCLLGISEMYAGDLSSAERHLKRAISINPSLALAYGYMAGVTGFRMDSAASARWAAQAEELSPADPMRPSTDAALSLSLFGEKDYQRALEVADGALDRSPDFGSGWRLRAASLEMLGDHEGAAAAVKKLLEIAPVTMEWFIREGTPLADPDAWARYLDALRQAGVPET